jgi:hypothetical protein
MAEFVPFDPVHMDFLQVHPDFAAQAARENPEALAQSREAWSLVDLERGDVLAVFGAVETYKGVIFLWGYLGRDVGFLDLLRLTRFFIVWVASLDAVRIETTVLKNWKCGHRWMRRRKFRRETARPMKLWDGFNDFHLYARVKP